MNNVFCKTCVVNLVVYFANFGFDLPILNEDVLNLNSFVHNFRFITKLKDIQCFQTFFSCSLLPRKVEYGETKGRLRCMLKSLSMINKLFILLCEIFQNSFTLWKKKWRCTLIYDLATLKSTQSRKKISELQVVKGWPQVIRTFVLFFVACSFLSSFFSRSASPDQMVDKIKQKEEEQEEPKWTRHSSSPCLSGWFLQP